MTTMAVELELKETDAFVEMTERMAAMRETTLRGVLVRMKMAREHEARMVTAPKALE